MKSFFILRLITIYAHSSCPPCSCYSFVYHSVVSPAAQGTGWFNATKSIEGLKGFYSLAILLQSTLGCTASLWIDPTVHFWQWIAKFIPSFLMPVVFHRPQDCSMVLSTIGLCPPRVSSQKIKQNVHLWIVPMSGKDFLQRLWYTKKVFVNRQIFKNSFLHFRDIFWFITITNIVCFSVWNLLTSRAKIRDLKSSWQSKKIPFDFKVLFRVQSILCNYSLYLSFTFHPRT